MKNKISILSVVLVFVFCAFTDRKNEKKKISNQLYSFSVPSDWECAAPGRVTEDCYRPEERNAYIYHLYYLSWRSPVKNEDDFFNSILLAIESYQRPDSLPATINEIEEIEMTRLKYAGTRFDKKIISSDKQQKRFIIQRETQSISAKKGTSIDKITTVYLLHKSKKIIHCVTLSTRTSIYQFPETKKIINDILDSFSNL